MMDCRVPPHYSVTSFPYRDGSFGYTVWDLTRRSELVPRLPFVLATSESGSATEKRAVDNGKRWLKRHLKRSPA